MWLDHQTVWIDLSLIIYISCSQQHAMNLFFMMGGLVQPHLAPETWFQYQNVAIPEKFNVTPNQEYSVRVAAVNSAGNGPFSEPIIVVLILVSDSLLSHMHAIGLIVDMTLC